MRHRDALQQTLMEARPAPSRPPLHLSPPSLSGRELALVHEVFASNYVAPAGPMLGRFEAAMAEATGFRHCVAVTSGTAALHLALHCLGVGPGDVVLAADLTFVGGVSPIVMRGAEPVFIDADRATWTMDPDLLGEAVTALEREGRRPKAVIPCDLYGQSADLDALQAVLEPLAIPLVADSAEAMGARYKDRHAGKGAALAAYSFNGNKIITSGGGGMLAADDHGIIERARYLSQQARQPVAHYEHVELGYNYRMSNVLAAIGLGQLERLQERVDRRRAVFETYRQLLGDLPGITFMPEAAYGIANRWLTCIVIDPAAFGADRDTVRGALAERSIESRPLWKPMHLQPVFADARHFGGTVGRELFANGLCLPSGDALGADDIERIVATIRAAAGWR
jgi:dTDP-4-amino-4,6-dideoxygalactose transaminase